MNAETSATTTAYATACANAIAAGKTEFSWNNQDWQIGANGSSWLRPTAALPDFSHKVLATLCGMLRYNDAGFSDVEASDIAAKLGVSEQAVGGAITNLLERDLINIEEWQTANGHRFFLHINVLD